MRRVFKLLYKKKHLPGDIAWNGVVYYYAPVVRAIFNIVTSDEGSTRLCCLRSLLTCSKRIINFLTSMGVSSIYKHGMVYSGYT